MYGWIIGFTPRYTTKPVQSIQMNNFLQDRNILNGKIPLPAVVYLLGEAQCIRDCKRRTVVKDAHAAVCSEILMLVAPDEHKIGGAASVHDGFEGEFEPAFRILYLPRLFRMFLVEGEGHVAQLMNDVVVDDGILTCRSPV